MALPAVPAIPVEGEVDDLPIVVLFGCAWVVNVIGDHDHYDLVIEARREDEWLKSRNRLPRA